MARPHKEGLDYFSFDVDFYENKKIRRIMRGCGPGSGTILTCLLCTIYREKGYYISWDDDLPFDIADKIGVSEGAVSEVITKAIQVEFFDSYQFKENKVLTSEEIQKRYKSATSKRHEVVIEKSFTVFSDRKGVNGGNNPVNGGDNEQSKVKESIVNESNKANAFVGQVPTDPPAGNKKRQRTNLNLRGDSQLPKQYGELLKSLEGKTTADIWGGIKDFILQNQPSFIEPYVDLWNVFVTSGKMKPYDLAKVEYISDSRKKKLKTRLGESAFDFLKILEKIKMNGQWKGDNRGNWKVAFDWILENDSNYVKILES